MSMQEEPGHSPGMPGQSPGTEPDQALLRRRVVFELTPSQLPLLEAAERRHGSKRRALIAALAADAEIEALREAAGQADQSAAKEAAEQRREAAKKGKATEKLERELEEARAELVRRDEEVERLQGEAVKGEEAEAELEEAQSDWREASDAQLEEITELRGRAVDHLFCARCGEWAPPSEWAWTRGEDGGRYAHHKLCGDHGPGVIDASSWLAHRRR